MKATNKSNAIDKMVIEARLERALGKIKSFISAEELIRDLHSNIDDHDDYKK